MFFNRANSVEKQLLNFKNASVLHCFINSLLTTIWNNLGLSTYKCMKRNLEFREKKHFKKHSFINTFSKIFFQGQWNGDIPQMH